MSQIVSSIALAFLVVSAMRVEVSTSKSAFPESVNLTEALIEEAIADGRAGKIRPYRLSHPIQGSPHQQVAVYTPYVRVGLAAAHREHASSAASAAELPGWLTEPTLHFVFRAPCQKPPCEYPGNYRIDQSSLPLVFVGPRTASVASPSQDRATHQSLPRGVLGPAVESTGVSSDLRFLDALGGPPFEGATAVATFGASVIKPSAFVYAVWSFGGDTVRVYSGSQVTSEDIRAWR